MIPVPEVVQRRHRVVIADDEHTVVRFDQRGCGRSSGQQGLFTIARAVEDLDQLRRGLGFDRWAVAGHSWGAELALRYAAHHPERTTAVAYIAGVGAGDDFKAGYAAEWERRMGPDRRRWQELDERARTPVEEQEWCASCSGARTSLPRVIPLRRRERCGPRVRPARRSTDRPAGGCGLTAPG